MNRIPVREIDKETIPYKVDVMGINSNFLSEAEGIPLLSLRIDSKFIASKAPKVIYIFLRCLSSSSN
jgi:hypothetical protein